MVLWSSLLVSRSSLLARLSTCICARAALSQSCSYSCLLLFMGSQSTLMFYLLLEWARSNFIVNSYKAGTIYMHKLKIRSFSGMDFQAFLRKKLVDLIGEDAVEEVGGLGAEQAFRKICCFYEDQLSSIKEELGKAVTINSEFKASQLERNQREAELKSMLDAARQHKELDAQSNCPSQHSDDNLQLKAQISNLQQQVEAAAKLHEQAAKLHEQAEADVKGLQEQVEAANKREEELASLLQKTRQDHERVLEQKEQLIQELNCLKQEIKELRAEVLNKEAAYIQALQNSKKELLKQMDARQRVLDQEYRKSKNQEINEIKKDRDLYKSQVDLVINELNPMLEINLVGSDDIKEWISKFKASFQKLKQEIDDACLPNTNSQNNYISKFSQLQKEKIAARRMYLIKTVIATTK